MGRWYAALKEHENAQTPNPHKVQKGVEDAFEPSEGSQSERIQNLFGAPSDDEKWIEFEERAAILEYDGGFSRVEAERRARLEVYGR